MAIPGTFPLQYTGVNAPNPAQPYIFHRDPTVTDYIGYNINDIWLNQRKIPGNPPTYNTSHIWQLVSKAQNIGTWVEISHTGLTEDLPAHSVVLGLGVPGLGSTGPDASVGIPLISQGLGSDPLFGTCLVQGGGTGQETLANHSVLVGADVAGITQVSPNATLGQPLVSNGTSADPSFGTASVSGGGTGLDVVPQYAVVCGGITGEGPLQTVSGLGTASQVLTSNGAGLLPTWQDGGGGGGTGGPIAVQVFSTPGSFTYTPTFGMASCIVEVVGGGGGGAGVNVGSFTGGAGGGGAGGYTRKFFLASGLSATEPVVVGAAGVGGVGGTSTDATNGGNSTFGTGPLLTAGGGAGVPIPSGAGTNAGGAGGTAAGGDINIIGDNGFANAYYVAAGGQSAGYSVGTGGSTIYGAGGIGGIGSSGSTAGSDSTGFGSGGGGAQSDGAGNVDGGDGSGGLIIVTEFGPYSPTPPSAPFTLNTIVFDTPGADTYTPSVGMFQCVVECVGGGGGGDYYNTGDSAGAGGGAGYCKKLFDSATIGASQPLVIGAGGTGSHGVTAGLNGVSSTFSSGPTLITAGFGYAGNNGGIGGTSTGGDLNVSGQSTPSVASLSANFLFSIQPSGISGNSAMGFGSGVGPVYSPTVGINGSGYGSGGGSVYNSSGQPGGSDCGHGASGVIIVTEYIS